MNIRSFHPIRSCILGNLLMRVFALSYFFAFPLIIMVVCLSDTHLRQGDIPTWAFSLHQRLSPHMDQWARERVSGGQATTLNDNDVPSTEWPLFGATFYLWATESLQDAWDKDPMLSGTPPNVYAADAIRSTTKLVLDLNHATWVRNKWGDDYLYQENCFFRMMLINAMTIHQKLLGDRQYEDRLRTQIDRLVTELDASPLGLIDDYPGECWVTDVVAILAAIQRANRILGTDHAEFIQRARRAFQGELLDETGLPPYVADSETGYIEPARGSTSLWGATWAPEIWPDIAQQWYHAFERHFWQDRWGITGVREFKKTSRAPEWTYDVDAGPIVGGFGSATTAFSIGAARANGRFDHAYALTAETILLSWPLPDGTLVLPRILSSGLHAPYVGEAALLYNVTRMPPADVPKVFGTSTPLLVYIGLGVITLLVCIEGRSIQRSFKQCRIRLSKRIYVRPHSQFIAWLCLIVAGITIWFFGYLFVGLLFIGAAHFLPHGSKRLEPIECTEDVS